MLHDEVEALKSKLQIARNEINNLRQQVKNLQCKQRNDIEGVSRYLHEFRCKGCREEQSVLAAQPVERAEQHGNLESIDEDKMEKKDISFRPIGYIRTAFAEKRAVPRQASVSGHLGGLIELDHSTFTNPEHALEGLNEFSHLWIIYHFHKNCSHPKAKVAPPRLGGERVGVFSTRSPHRPCPIGLSLVEIDKIEGSVIKFFGTDMVDGTPVLDVKPYIPHYDAPMASGATADNSGGTEDFYDMRQEPDGEETENEVINTHNLQGAVGGTVIACKPKTHTNTVSSVGSSATISTDTLLSRISNTVRVPNWIVSNQHLRVLFNERSEAQLNELKIERQSITEILEADPRSIYLRTKYGSQIFTFQLSDATVTCKFDDNAGTVNVVHVRPKETIESYEETSNASSKPIG